MPAIFLVDSGFITMQTSASQIRAARVVELERLQDIERSAGQVFADIGMSEIAAHEPPATEDLLAYLRREHLWVHTAGTPDPVAYMMVDILDAKVHIEQISVAVAFAGQKLGRAMLEWLALWAQQRNFDALTLTTFSDVPWNAPYYQRCGFQNMPDNQIGAELKAVRQHEIALGLDKWPRVCMYRSL